MLIYHSAVFIDVYVTAIVPAAHSEDKKSWYWNKARGTHEHHISTGVVLKSAVIAG